MKEKPVTGKKKLSKSAQKTAAKVQLMKLKMKSRGQTSLPEDERVYFLVEPPKVRSKFLFRNTSSFKLSLVCLYV